MKRLLIALLLFVALWGFNIGLDMIGGFSIQQSIMNLITPMRVMDPSGKFIVALSFIVLGLDLFWQQIHKLLPDVSVTENSPQGNKHQHSDSKEQAK